MEKLAIFCKSYDRDMYRARRMAESVQRFNRDGIPFYLSVPTKDLPAFQQCFSGIPCTFLTDEEVLSSGKLPPLFPPHLHQQLVKLEFWRLGLCSNYAWIDSDSYFIKEFRTADFFYDEEEPFVIQEEFNIQKFQEKWSSVSPDVRNKRIRQNQELIEKFRRLFGNTSTPFVYFGESTPVIWSCKVLQSLYEDYLKEARKTICQLLYEFPCETHLYGEYLHFSKVIPIRPRRAMFRNFHYADEFYLSQMLGESEYSIAKDYYGITFQTNWASARERKKALPRLKKHLREWLAFIFPAKARG